VSAKCKLSCQSTAGLFSTVATGPRVSLRSARNQVTMVGELTVEIGLFEAVADT